MYKMIFYLESLLKGSQTLRFHTATLVHADVRPIPLYKSNCYK